jgi:hypothetical protein
MNILIVGFVVSVVPMNAVVTFLLTRTDLFQPKQKVAQTLIVWLVPVIGAVGIAVFLYSNHERPHVRSHHIPQEESDWVPGSDRSGADD